MTIEDYKRSLRKPVQQHVVTFLRRGEQVLLGKRKKTFGKEKWVGIGGKVDPGETPKEAALREVLEETGITILGEFQTVGFLQFWFPQVEDESWNEDVTVYLAHEFEGTLQETEEILPQWFHIGKLPFEQMWDDARHWIPRILSGEKVIGEFLFNESLRVVEHTVRPLTAL